MNWNIKNKLFGGYSIILALLIFMTLFMIGKLSQSNQRLLDIIEGSSKKTNLSNEIMIAVLDATRHEKNLILEKDILLKDYYKDRIYRALPSIDEKTTQLQALIDDKDQDILNEFKSTWEEYLPALDETIRLSIKGEDHSAFKISTEKGLQTRDKAISIMRRLIEKNEKSILEDKIANGTAYTDSVNLIVLMIIISVFLAVGISFSIIQGITRRIAGITKEAEKIASREFTDEKLKDTINDELKPIFSSLININESFREITLNANKVAAGNYSSGIQPRSENDILGHSLKKMTYSLQEATAANEKHNWLTTGQNLLNEKLIGDKDLETLAHNAVGFLCSYMKANIGAVYLLNDKTKTFVLSGQYAFSSPDDAPKIYALNEGLIGQVAQEQKEIILTNLTDDHIRVTSSLINTKPKHLIIYPFVFEGKTLGVIEMGKLSMFSEVEKEFLATAVKNIAIMVNSALAGKRIRELLEETQIQSEELQSQQEELKQMNEELEEQAQGLKQQQEELQMTNEELEEQTQSLEMKNKEVEAAKEDIEQKTKQLEISSRYKSEFLANMSHELRTPLNSLLILSKHLSENSKKNLSHDQVESAEIIYKSGQDLLLLINEVLDLSKIEAGKMSITIERISLTNFINTLSKDFRHHAEQKGLKLDFKLDNALPEFIHSDSQRLNQVLKNLLSNAIKFTEKGSVSVTLKRHTESAIEISVSDTGIGIAEDKQLAIFEAFQQADGGTSRKYGGTGLGLSISRELAKLLNGEIKLHSKSNKGSTFSLIIPLELNDNKVHATGSEPLTVNPTEYKLYSGSGSEYLNYPAIDDDRRTITSGDKIVLVIEDDPKFASILLKQANQKGFKCLAAATGEDGLVLAVKYKPHAIILDLDLPGISGHKVLSELKANPVIRHIPVHIASVNERSLNPIKEGAIEYLVKPIDKNDLEEAFNRIENFINRKMKNLLIIEDDTNARKAIRMLIGNGDVKCFEAGTAKEAIATYQNTHIDCIVLDIGLPDMSGFELIYELEKIKAHLPPIIIYTGKELTKAENDELQKYAESIIIKGVKSEDRLLDETALFLHRTISNMPESKQLIINNLYDKEIVFHAKKILLADDDMRNVFALSKTLKERGMDIIKAENGLNALEMLEKNPDIDLVLMDIMMPEMDGYEAMRRIRSQLKYKQLPIIALTAKAMKDDKQKCIDAGANDYITKPVDVERLLSLMRVWLNK